MPKKLKKMIKLITSSTHPRFYLNVAFAFHTGRRLDKNFSGTIASSINENTYTNEDGISPFSGLSYDLTILCLPCLLFETSNFQSFSHYL